MHGAPQPDLPPMAIGDLLAGLATGLSGLGDFGSISAGDLKPIPTTGLAHDHVRLIGHGLLARVPKQSQMALDAETNLTYQAACFMRAAGSGHTPRLQAVVPPSNDLPTGAPVVEESDGTCLTRRDPCQSLPPARAALPTPPPPAGAYSAPVKNPPEK